jgi:hypothetical protein
MTFCAYSKPAEISKWSWIVDPKICTASSLPVSFISFRFAVASYENIEPFSCRENCRACLLRDIGGWARLHT